VRARTCTRARSVDVREQRDEHACGTTASGHQHMSSPPARTGLASPPALHGRIAARVPDRRGFAGLRPPRGFRSAWCGRVRQRVSWGVKVLTRLEFFAAVARPRMEYLPRVNRSRLRPADDARQRLERRATWRRARFATCILLADRMQKKRFWWRAGGGGQDGLGRAMGHRAGPGAIPDSCLRRGLDEARRSPRGVAKQCCTRS